MKEPYLPSDFHSDECTFPGPLKYVRWLLGARKYYIFCREHDFTRRYNIIPWYAANWLLAKRIATDGIAGKLRAPIYLFFTSVSYPVMHKTLDLPPQWEMYAEYYRSM